ncbi:MAG TPA: tripartite tricarboxylate transporter substrate-binding protein [Burkholderiales bacterium]|nr:tripartite tricarboxylate transporter substrate-binding protein [Burkholderiales bacterium]
MTLLATMRAIVLASLLAVAPCALAQSQYPAKPIRVIIPYPPGGSNDIMGRLVSQKLSEGLGVTAVVDNRGGGNGIIGTEALVRAAPDGHTILIASINSHLLTALMSPTPYHPIKDFAAVGAIDSSDYLMVVHPGVAANSLQEFIALAKARPGQLNYATSTNSVLVTTAMFITRAGIKLQHIPYKGAGPALNDLLGGHVQMFFSTPSSMVAHVKNGKVKPLAVTAETRLQALPNVPTFAESGIANFDVKALRGMLAPRRTPKAIVDRLSGELGRILAMPDINEKMSAHGMTAYFTTPAVLQSRMETDLVKYAQALKTVDVAGER